MAETQRNIKAQKQAREFDLRKFQSMYVYGGLCLLPFAPFLYLQGQYTRWKVGRLPDAGGATTGELESNGPTIRFLAIGESTVAGIGAKTHAEALTGQFAKHLSDHLEKKVEWHALGHSGITVRRTLDELIPNLPEKEFDAILVALGANDVFTVNSPENFRKDMKELLDLLRKKNPNARIFLANVPMVRDFIALPNPLRYILSRLAKLHHFNAIDLVSKMPEVYYYDDVGAVKEDFFSDGIHPSAHGYDLWAEAMVKYFIGIAGRF
ncbi:MAG: SGNH/GDSL hydrolase family protein [Acidobacteria bacterium]|nr:SGNH/GDSL hydrolase family protein [Acidobacteriota bacterium]